MQRIEQIQIGSDIELFLQHKATKEIVSAEGFIKGSKHDPFVFDKTNKYFATSLDNVLCEFCIPPATNAEEFYNNIRKSMGYIDSILPDEYCTVALPSARLHERFLQTEQAQVFGCEPDFNAYTGTMNQSPYSEDAHLRSAALHLHVSYAYPINYDWFNYEPDECRTQLVKAMDLHLGVPAIIMEPKNRRRELYGKAGSFRPKPYGLEYRVLSNHFVNDKGKIVWAYDSTMDAINYLNNGGTIEGDLSTMVQHTINTSNKKDAEKLIKDFNLKTA